MIKANQQPPLYNPPADIAALMARGTVMNLPTAAHLNISGEGA